MCVRKVDGCLHGICKQAAGGSRNLCKPEMPFTQTRSSSPPLHPPPPTHTLLPPHHQQGLKVSRPSGWNQFEGSPETYVVKWSDIINRDELVILNSTPVKASTTAVDALGDVQEVGQKLAKGRGAELVEAKARLTEGVLFYEFEFKGKAVSELASLCVAKGRLWNLSATAATKRWAKKRDLLKGVIGSFLPKL